MKITVKDNHTCRTQRIHLLKEFTSKLSAARELLFLWDKINTANSDGYYVMSKKEAEEEARENGKDLIVECSRSAKYFALPVVSLQAENYLMFCVHGMVYYLPDNLTEENLFSLAVSLINSGDQTCEIEND